MGMNQQENHLEVAETGCHSLVCLKIVGEKYQKQGINQFCNVTVKHDPHVHDGR